MKKLNEYIIYGKDDFPIFIGNKKECMNFLNYKEKSFYSLLTCTKEGKKVVLEFSKLKIDLEIIS